MCIGSSCVYVMSGVDVSGQAPGKNGTDDLRSGRRQRRGDADMVEVGRRTGRRPEFGGGQLR